MADGVTIRIEGLRELGAKMRGLSEKVNNKIAASAASAGATIVKKAARANIERSPSIETRSLLDAVIVKKVPKSQAEFTAEYIVTARGRGKVKINKNGVKQAQAPHASKVEFGTVNMAAEPWLRPALDNNLQKAGNAMKDRLAKRIEAASK